MRLSIFLILIFFLTALPVQAAYDRPLSDMMGVKMYTDMLKKHAAKGDQWSTLRLEEVNKGLKVAETGKKFEDTSWWNLPGKAKLGWDAYWQEKDYHGAAVDRRKYETLMNHYGYTSSGQSAEKWQRMAVQLGATLGISPTAREGQKLLDMLDKTEDKAFVLGETNGFLHPIKKLTLLKEMATDAKNLEEQRKRVEDAAKNDPIVQIGVAVKGIGDLFKGIFGKEKNSKGRISGDKFQDSLGIFSSNKDNLTRQIDQQSRNLQQELTRSGNELTRSLQGLQNSFQQLGRELQGIGNAFSVNNSGSNPSAPATRIERLNDRLQESIR